MNDEKRYNRPQLLQAVDEAMEEAEGALEKARHLLVYKDGQDGEPYYGAEDVHALALAQFEVGKTRERLNGTARRRKEKGR